MSERLLATLLRKESGGDRVDMILIIFLVTWLSLLSILVAVGIVIGLWCAFAAAPVVTTIVVAVVAALVWWIAGLIREASQP